MKASSRSISRAMAGCFVAIGLLTTAASAGTACFVPPISGAPYELLTHSKPQVSLEDLNAALAAVSQKMDLASDLKCGRRLNSTGTCLVQYPVTSENPDQLVDRLMHRLPGLAESDPKIRVIAKFTTNAPIRAGITAKPASPQAHAKKPRMRAEDDLYPEQMELQDLGSDIAWRGAALSPGIVTAVIDSGIERTHPDLKDQLVAGTDFPCPSGTCYGDPKDPAGHGTNMAGYIVADSDRKGITGVAWNTRAMPLAFSMNGVSDDFRAGDAIEYAVDKGVAIINASWYSTCKLEEVIKQVDYAETKKILFVGTAGNQSSDIDGAYDSFPAQDHRENMLIVMGHDTKPNYEIADSNFGKTSVDLAAPGTGYTTMICEDDNCHTAGVISSTSAATAYVSGAAALLKSFYPTWGYDELIWRITGTVITGGTLKDKNKYDGRLSLANMMRPVHVLTLTGNGEVMRRKDQKIGWKAAFRSDMCPKISIDAQVDRGAVKTVVTDAPTSDEMAPADLSNLANGSKVTFKARCGQLHPALSVEYPLVN